MKIMPKLIDGLDQNVKSPIKKEEVQEILDNHDCHKTQYGEDGCECDNIIIKGR